MRRESLEVCGVGEGLSRIGEPVWGSGGKKGGGLRVDGSTGEAR